MNRLKQIYRWVRFRHGFGVHSPYAFSFINDVIEEKNGYYGYLDIPNRLSKVQLKPSFTRAYSLKYHLLLFRIGHFFQPNRIVFLGHEMAETILYLKATNQRANCLLIDLASPKMSKTKALLEGDATIRFSEVEENDIQQEWINALNNSEKAEIYYFHQSIDLITKQKAVECCLERIDKRPILFLFDHINRSLQEREFWSWLKSNQQITITFDLIRIGIAICHPRLIKQNYRLPY